MNHRTRRAARYKALGMDEQAAFAGGSPNNRSKRARGKLRARYWRWRGSGKNVYKVRGGHPYEIGVTLRPELQ